MHKNVHLIGVGTYHPEKQLDNQYFIEHFKKYGIEEHARGLMNKLGREVRTLAEEGETSVTMEVEAASQALINAGLTAQDIDMIISVSDTPEYLSPSCALLVKNQIKAENASAVFDVNCNCIGMITGIDVASRYLKTDDKYKRVLVVGAFLISPFSRKDDMVLLGCAADGAAAVILERREEDYERGILGSRMFTDDTYHWSITFPSCGLTNIRDNNIDPEDKKMLWKPFDFSFLSEKWSDTITQLLDEHEYEPNDVSHYFMSQFSRADLELTLEKLGSDISKATFVGNKYGYTGCTSPIMALDDRLKYHKFNKDDLVIFCSVASGYSIGTLLYKW